MSQSLKAVLFDLDGTLLDTAPDFAFIANLMLKKYGRAPIAYEQFRQSVSDGARGMVQAAFDFQLPDNVENLTLVGAAWAAWWLPRLVPRTRHRFPPRSSGTT